MKQVFYTCEGKLSSTFQIDELQNTAVISDLEPNTTYTIRVEAVTKDEKLLDVGEIQVTTENGQLKFQNCSIPMIEILIKLKNKIVRTSNLTVKLKENNNVDLIQCFSKGIKSYSQCKEMDKCPIPGSLLCPEK